MALSRQVTNLAKRLETLVMMQWRMKTLSWVLSNVFCAS